MMFMLSDVARILDGVLVGPDAPVTSIGIDSRKVSPGMLFFALRAARDGHAFAQSAIDRGASAAVVEREALAEFGTPTSAILVDKVYNSLFRLAKWWRSQFSTIIIAVTGSNGKTTTKEMIASILASAMSDAYYATPGNFNNEIGVPLSLFGLRAHHRLAVIEIGMNHPGEVRKLASIVRPTVSIITNAQREHMANFKSLADVAKANSEVFEWTDAEGVAVINADDPFCDVWCDHTRRRRIVRCGLDDTADFRAASQVESEGTRMELLTLEGHRSVLLKAAGVHNVRNALGAAACAWAAGIHIDQIVEDLSQFMPVEGRLQFKPGVNESVVIDDTYNANPDSMEAALDVLAARKGHRIFVIGDMGEVGRRGLSFHSEVGQIASRLGIDRLFAVGELSAESVRYFNGEKHHFSSKEELVHALLPHLDEKTTVLVKGSRFMKMEEVVSKLVEEKD